MIGINPVVFWEMSITEISLAVKGFIEFNGGKKSGSMDKEDLEELMEMYPDN
tara:strand:+ start:3533 stop:3688 length:156 start_codon:yes stop_codon:yes gene_type:complete